MIYSVAELWGSDGKFPLIPPSKWFDCWGTITVTIRVISGYYYEVYIGAILGVLLGLLQGLHWVLLGLYRGYYHPISLVIFNVLFHGMLH